MTVFTRQLKMMRTGSSTIPKTPGPSKCFSSHLRSKPLRLHLPVPSYCGQGFKHSHWLIYECLIHQIPIFNASPGHFCTVAGNVCLLLERTVSPRTGPFCSSTSSRLFKEEDKRTHPKAPASRLCILHPELKQAEPLWQMWLQRAVSL